MELLGAAGIARVDDHVADLLGGHAHVQRGVEQTHLGQVADELHADIRRLDAGVDDADAVGGLEVPVARPAGLEQRRQGGGVPGFWPVRNRE